MSSRLRNIARIRSGARELGDRMSPQGKAKLIAKFLAMYGKPPLKDYGHQTAPTIAIDLNAVPEGDYAMAMVDLPNLANPKVVTP